MSGSARMAQILTGALVARRSSEIAKSNPLMLKTSRRVKKSFGVFVSLRYVMGNVK